MNPDLQTPLQQGAQALGLALSAAQLQQLLGYLTLLQKWNQVYNLTAVRDPQAMLTHHLLDSLAVVAPLRRHLHSARSGVAAAVPASATPAAVSAGAGGAEAAARSASTPLPTAPQATPPQHATNGQPRPQAQAQDQAQEQAQPQPQPQGQGRAPRLLDVGSGGGLPGVVIAICCPGMVVHCVDTVAKKAAFIQQVAASLRLPGLRGIHARVEQLPLAGQGGAYDVVCARAFASLADFTAWSAQALAPNGVWMAMKGKPPTDELTALPAQVQLFHVEPLTVPGLDAERCLLWLRRSGAAAG